MVSLSEMPRHRPCELWPGSPSHPAMALEGREIHPAHVERRPSSRRLESRQACARAALVCLWRRLATAAAVSQQTDLQALRCPFCGGEPELLTGDNTWSQIGCKLCGAKGPEFMLNDTKALAGWNRRALLTAAAPAATQSKDARAQGDDLAVEFMQKFPTATVDRNHLGAWFHGAMQIGADMVCQEHQLIREQRDCLLAALKAIVETGDDCPACDRGVLRHPENGHWPTCPFGHAQIAIAAVAEAGADPQKEKS